MRNFYKKPTNKKDIVTRQFRRRPNPRKGFLMAYSQDFIFGAASHEGRLARGRCEYGHRGFVVVAEMAHRSYQELDADSAEHGARLAQEWVSHFGAISASVQAVRPNGSLKFVALIAPDHSAA